MTASTCAPVLLLIFNRADLTEKVFAMLQQAKPGKLFISADGPRNVQEKEQCDATRAVTEKIDWPCEVHRNYFEHNIGCKQAVSHGITWFFEHVEAGIILEDDCLPSLSFFSFTTTLLDRYKDDRSIGHIGGFNPLSVKDESSANYYYLEGCTIWGWASWRRVWAHYDVDPVAHNLVEWKYFKGPFFFKLYILKKLYRIALGSLNTWDFQYQYTLWKNSMSSIIPKNSHIQNIGFDNRSTHTRKVVSGAVNCQVSFLNPHEFNPSKEMLLSQKLDTQMRKKFFNRSPFVVVVKLNIRYKYKTHEKNYLFSSNRTIILVGLRE
jgi:hypothetical protein